jgi:hypothetical protein
VSSPEINVKGSMDDPKSNRVIVAVRPRIAGLAEDKLFYSNNHIHVGDASHWMEPYRTLAKVGLSSGLEFHTDDVVDVERASVFIFGEMPASPQEVAQLRESYPHLKFILQILETPLGRKWVFSPENHSDFDAVISYDPTRNDGSRYRSFNIPIGGLEIDVPSGSTWRERKIACLVAHVPNVRPFLVRRTGFRMMLNGWKFTPQTWWNYVTEGGSLYRERLQMARDCEELLGDQFDIFGPGWPKAERGVDFGKGFTSARGPYRGSKLELLQNYRFNIAYENCLNDCGYISEKLFDALLAGCVPVYLGNRSIQRYVPEQVFVDARKFATHVDLIGYIRSMSDEQWRDMRNAGAAFLHTEAGAQFGSMQYVQCVMDAIRFVLN